MREGGNDAFGCDFGEKEELFKCLFPDRGTARSGQLWLCLQRRGTRERTRTSYMEEVCQGHGRREGGSTEPAPTAGRGR